VRVTAPHGTTDTTTYDVLNRVTRRENALAAVTQFQYLDSVTIVTDARGQRYRSWTNALGWDTLVTDTLGSQRYARNRLGQVVRWVNRRSQTTTFAYDSLGRLIGRGLSDTSRVRWYEHYPTHLVSADRAGAATISDTVRMVQDTTYSITVRRGVPFTVRARGVRTERRQTVAVWSPYADVIETDCRLDSAAQVRAIYPIGASRDTLAYSAEGALARTWRNTAYSVLNAYRPRHDLARDSFTLSALQTAFGREFVHDTLGRVVEARDSNRTRFERYSYDTAGRLTGFSRWLTSSACTPTDTTSELGAACTTGTSRVDTVGYAYDAVGNPSGAGITVGSGNRLTAWGGYSFEFDADGNLTRKSQANVLDQYFYWTSANELDSVRTWRPGTGWQTVRFRYDAAGRRAMKIVGSDTTNYVWAGDHVVGEYRQDGTVLRTYAYYPGTDQPHSVWSNDGTRRYFVSDGRGNVVGLVDSTGTSVARYRYRPFGDSAAAVASVGNAYRFAGRELDGETGLYYNRARYYDPQVGRFISQDPIGLDGGINPYSFAGNDPVNARDPSGYGCRWRTVEKEAMTSGPAGAGGGRHGQYEVFECFDPVGSSIGPTSWGPLHDWGLLWGTTNSTYASGSYAGASQEHRRLFQVWDDRPGSQISQCRPRLTYLFPRALVVGVPTEELAIAVDREGPRGLRFANYSGRVWHTAGGVRSEYPVRGFAICGLGYLELHPTGEPMAIP
jgi:RHS repeat-associated protein